MNSSPKKSKDVLAIVAGVSPTNASALEVTAKNQNSVLNLGEAVELPTTFELALLAVNIASKQETDANPSVVVLQAMDYWEEARNVRVAKSQFRKLIDGLFDLKQEEWNKILIEYVGDRLFLAKMITGQHKESPRFNSEGYVLRQLFNAKNETASTRLTKLRELVAFATQSGWGRFKPLNPMKPHEKRKHDEELSPYGKLKTSNKCFEEDDLDILAVRMLVNARQGYISEARAKAARMKRLKRAVGQRKKRAKAV